MGVSQRQRALVEGMGAVEDYDWDVDRTAVNEGVDVTRLQTELDFLHRNPRLHDQDVYTRIVREDNVCGTAGCLAGWTVLHEAHANPQSEYTVVYRDARTGDRLTESDASAMRWAAELIPARRVDLPAVGKSAWGLGRDHFHEIATGLLGLTEEEAEILFSGSNTLPEMYAFAALITDGAVVDPYEPAE